MKNPNQQKKGLNQKLMLVLLLLLFLFSKYKDKIMSCINENDESNPGEGAGTGNENYPPVPGIINLPPFNPGVLNVDVSRERFERANDEDILDVPNDFIKRTFFQDKGVVQLTRNLDV